jgi:hypothetical protein
MVVSNQLYDKSEDYSPSQLSRFCSDITCNESLITVLAIKYSFQKFLRGVPSTLIDQINGFVINQTKEFHPFASRIGKEELQEIGESGM